MRLIDISGQIFSGIKVESRAGKDPTSKTTWNCECHCGRRFVATGLNLKSGNTKSCGCNKRRPQRFDISGKRFDRLTALSIEKVVNGVVFWRCVCDCGQKTTVTYAHLIGNHTKSCGCLMIETSKKLAKENLGGTKENHPRWRSDLSDEERQNERPGQAAWSRAILERDRFMCVKCSKGGKLHAHHIIGFASCRERREDISNGATLCESCHTDFHKLYGQKGFSRADFFEWLKCPDPGDFSFIGRPPKWFSGVAEFISSDAIEDLEKARWYLDREISRRKKARST